MKTLRIIPAFIMLGLIGFQSIQVILTYMHEADNVHTSIFEGSEESESNEEKREHLEKNKNELIEPTVNQYRFMNSTVSLRYVHTVVSQTNIEVPDPPPDHRA